MEVALSGKSEAPIPLTLSSCCWESEPPAGLIEGHRSARGLFGSDPDRRTEGRRRRCELCFSAKIHRRLDQTLTRDRGGFFMKSLNSLQPVGLLLLRLALGLIFFSHGYPKLAHSGAAMQSFFVDHGLSGCFVYMSRGVEV